MHKLLESSLANHAEKDAIVYQGKGYSFKWLHDTSLAFAAALQSNGIKRLAFCLHNSPVNIILYLAGSLAGVETLAVNPRLTAFELGNILKEFQPNLFLIESNRYCEGLESTLDHSITRPLLIDAENPMTGRFNDWVSEGENLSLNDVAVASVLHLTSGAMGQVKYCEHSFDQAYTYGRNREKDMGYEMTDTLLVCLSLNHAFAFSYQLLPALAAGLTLYLVAEFSEVAIQNQIEQYPITSLALLPTMAYQLALHAETDTTLSHSLRYCLVAGDALPSAFQNKFKSVFSVPLYQGVGMTEVYGYAQNTPVRVKHESSGRLFDSVQVDIRNEQNESLGVNQLGEVFVKNDATLSQYLFQAELSQAEIQDGWVRSGDMGYVDEDRHFYFMGRKKQIIIRGGSNIAPVEVESVLYRHSHVLQCAVVGKDDPVWGQVVWAYVVPIKEGALSESELFVHCEGFLASYKLPAKIHFVDALPQNATGKIDRFELKALANATQ